MVFSIIKYIKNMLWGTNDNQKGKNKTTIKIVNTNTNKISNNELLEGIKSKIKRGFKPVKKRKLRKRKVNSSNLILEFMKNRRQFIISDSDDEY